ncbi:dipeptide epimerase [Sinimarinibacterium sp. CAU 1509]|uniref:dipeptide epimerase n=1 Tax=Sinimarinibacterium sp. CAU 1509 TaxID=2562283 RepID=UPI0010AC911B|nr:dipeptide epimerase [Sinimarinibacterium sp. CAU 1509]TJY59723.1 dipeptide epimerase [Sinimarinibacterium sp. CAU 1509]
MKRRLKAKIESRPLKTPLRITGHSFDTYELLSVEIEEGSVTGRGEAWGVYFKGETAADLLSQVEAVSSELCSGASREDLIRILPAGGARNALDCALWELESKLKRVPVASLVGLNGTRPLQTMYTLSADTPSEMAKMALDFGPARIIKLKLTGDPEDSERVRAVGNARPEVALVVDANQGFTPDSLDALIPVLVSSRVELIEQPFPVGHEEGLSLIRSPIPIVADESVCDIEDLERLRGRVQAINIKLDKCGGLTRGLQLAHEARGMGFDLMVGCMLGTSLAAAPGFVIGQICRYVDLDLVLRCVTDRVPGVQYDQGWIKCGPAVWGFDPSGESTS